MLEDLRKALLRDHGAQNTRPLMVIALLLTYCGGDDVVSLLGQRSLLLMWVVFDLLRDLSSLLQGVLRRWMIADGARREHYLALRLGLGRQCVRLVLSKGERRYLGFVPGRFSRLHDGLCRWLCHGFEGLCAVAAPGQRPLAGHLLLLMRLVNRTDEGACDFLDSA